MNSVNPVQVVAVSGGKGGVGKSNVSVNMAIALAEQGKRVVLLDADLGLANLDILLGLSVNKNISDVLAGEATLSEVMVEGPSGIKIIPASSGTQQMANLGEVEHAGIITAFSELSDYMDVLIVDTAAGISKTVTSFVRASQETLIVVTDEPTSIADAYALIKVLERDCRLNRFRVVANMVRTPKEGQALFNKLATVADRFLDVTLQYCGSIPMDEAVRKSVQRQKAVLEAYPRSKAAVAYRSLAQKVATWPLPVTPKGNLEFFVERLVHGVGVA
ncbi:MinD/ParA family protein [Reinekea forsetii]|nr:MinD/ParA family protein [Reinekea forsetii]